MHTRGHAASGFPRLSRSDPRQYGSAGQDLSRMAGIQDPALQQSPAFLHAVLRHLRLPALPRLDLQCGVSLRPGARLRLPGRSLLSRPLRNHSDARKGRDPLRLNGGNSPAARHEKNGAPARDLEEGRKGASQGAGRYRLSRGLSGGPVRRLPHQGYARSGRHSRGLPLVRLVVP